MRSKKWLISCSYNPNVNSIQKHLSQISRGIDFYSTKYENFIVMGDFNIDISSLGVGFDKLSEFINLFDLTNLIKENTCITKDHQSTIDLILTNRPLSFQKTKVTETGLSDYHMLISSFFFF